MIIQRPVLHYHIFYCAISQNGTDIQEATNLLHQPLVCPNKVGQSPKAMIKVYQKT